MSQSQEEEAPSLDSMTPQEARHLLSLPDTATTSEVHKRYRHLALKTHPDKGGSAAQFQLLTAAFQALQPAGAVEEKYAKSYFVPEPTGGTEAYRAGGEPSKGTGDDAYFAPPDAVVALDLEIFRRMLAGDVAVDDVFPELEATDRDLDLLIVDARNKGERAATGAACVDDFGRVGINVQVAILPMECCVVYDHYRNPTSEQCLTWDGYRRSPHFRRERTSGAKRWWAPDLAETRKARFARDGLCGIPTHSRYLQRECTGTNFWGIALQSSRTRGARTDGPRIVGNEFDLTAEREF